MEGGALAGLAGRAMAAARGTDARILVNDRVDVALAVGAHGVHLRGTSVGASRVRAVAPRGFVIGRSVHSADEGAQAESDGGLDFLIFGTVFETTSKPTAVPAGLARLAAACGAVALPVLGVGGITLQRLRGAGAAGSAGFAAINLFASAALDQLPDVVREATAAFDAR
jgi:thiamine-phosphate diphosphorylase